MVYNSSFFIKDVYHWLKSLRLHKYSQYFASLTYEQMLDLNDEQLMKYNITLGARKKILANLEKIKNRQKRLGEILKVRKISHLRIFLQKHN